MDSDTDLGGPAVVFPATRGSLVRAAASPDPTIRRRAQDSLITAYWKPIYKYIRIKWKRSNEDAKDLTQAFFVRALEQDFLDRFDPRKARFRTFVRLCVDGFVANEQRAASRLKRGGGTNLLSLDFEDADGELRQQPAALEMDLDDFFRQEWLRGLFALAVEDLRQECAAGGKEVRFKLFERYDLDNPEAGVRLTYAQLGQELGLSATQVTNHLAFARRQFRHFLLNRLRGTTGSDEEFQGEVRRLFGGDLA
jgi:RNA polymerase sigma factor (sigma-70 family)